jgi:hypothetical protein
MSTKIRMRFIVSFAFGIILAFSGLALAVNVGADAQAETVSNAGAGSIVTTQNVLTGDWSASFVENQAKLNLHFERRSEKGSKNQIGQSYDFSELQGLTREQALNGGVVKFSLVREAGTIACEGRFENGKGSGTYRFTPSQAFVSAMKTRGFDFEKDSPTTYEEEGRFENRLFTAAALNVTTALADDLTSAGFGKLGVSDLFKATIFKIDSTFMREMKASGFPNMDFDDLVKARIFKIDAKFVSEATQMGFGKESFESLVKLRIFKVTPEFIAEVRNEGLNALSVEDLVKLQIFKIDGAFIRQAKADGVPLEVERLVQRRIGVSHRRAL